MGFHRDELERTFQRELRMSLISRAAQGEAAGSSSKATKKSLRRKKQPAAASPDSKHKRAGHVKEKKPPETLFDAGATLRILVGASRSRAAARSEELQTLSPAQPLNFSPSAQPTTSAELSEARNALAAHLQRYSEDDDDTELPDEDRLPQTEAELEQELAWLRRKVAESRSEAKQEESALRERFAQRGKQITMQDYVDDEHVMSVRRRNSRYSRRQVTLLKLKKPGGKFGPRLPEGEEAEHAREDASSPTGGAVDGEVASIQASAASSAVQPTSAASSAAHPANKGSPSMELRAFEPSAEVQLLLQQESSKKKARRGASVGGAGAAVGMLAYNGGSLSMFERARIRFQKETDERKAAEEERMRKEEAAAAERRGKLEEQKVRIRRLSGEGARQRGDPTGQRKRRPRSSGRARAGLATDAAPGRAAAAAAAPVGANLNTDDGAAGSAAPRFGMAAPVAAVMAASRLKQLASEEEVAKGGETHGSSWLEQTLAQVGGHHAGEQEGSHTRWSAAIRNVRRALELRGVRDAIRLMRTLREQAEDFAAGLPAPRPPLGVPTNAKTLALMQHAFATERADRLGEVMEMCRDDARRRFVLGRDRYEAEMIESVHRKLSELEVAERSHEDGSVEVRFLTDQEAARLHAIDVLDGSHEGAAGDGDDGTRDGEILEALRQTRRGEKRADLVVGALQRLGYAAGDIATALRALVTREPAHVRELFALFDAAEGRGELDRSEVARSLAPLGQALCSESESESQARSVQRSDAHFLRQLRTLAQGGGMIAYNEFATLLRGADLVAQEDEAPPPAAAAEQGSFGRQFRVAGTAVGASFKMRSSFRRSSASSPASSSKGSSFKRSASSIRIDAANARAERQLMRHVPRRMRKACELLKSNMRSAGYSFADTRAVCRAMFISQEEAVLLPAWRVFDPMGRGKLSLTEVQAAFALFGDAVEQANVIAEFNRLDVDDSGSIELGEFGALLRRLAALARGLPAFGEAELGLVGTALAELTLADAIGLSLLSAIPLEMHPFARRLFDSLGALGFAPDQIEVVLRAIWHPEASEANEAARQAWLLLGGVDWGLARRADADVLAEVREAYEERRRRGQRWREQEQKRQQQEKRDEAARQEEEEEEEDPGEGLLRLSPRGSSPSLRKKKPSAWSRLRIQRKGGLAATALKAAAQDALERRRQNPDMLLYGGPPRREDEFDEWGSIPLSDFERIVAIFGDYQIDHEMRRCAAQLTKLFEVLDTETTGGNDGGGGGGDGDAGSFKSADGNSFTSSSYNGSFKYSALKRSVLSAAGAVPSAAAANAHGTLLQETGCDAFVEFIQKLRPLGPDEREGDAELMALSEQFVFTTNTANLRSRERVPAWMAAMARRASRASGDGAIGMAGLTGAHAGGTLGEDGEAKYGSSGGDGVEGKDALAALDALRKSLVAGRIDALELLDESTMKMVPLAHLSSIRHVLSNLRTANFDATESNVLVRALYSFGDDELGPAFRQEAWSLLLNKQFHLKTAADDLAGEIGEFRSGEHKYKLPGVAALRKGSGGDGEVGEGDSGLPSQPLHQTGRTPSKEGEAAEEEGLSEDELQLMVSMLGEHLSQGQLNALSASFEFNARGRATFHEVERILRFMYPRIGSHTGSIKDNEARAREMETELNGGAVGLSALDNFGRAAGATIAGMVRNLMR